MNIKLCPISETYATNGPVSKNWLLLWHVGFQKKVNMLDKNKNTFTKSYMEENAGSDSREINMTVSNRFHLYAHIYVTYPYHIYISYCSNKMYLFPSMNCSMLPNVTFQALHYFKDIWIRLHKTAHYITEYRLHINVTSRTYPCLPSCLVKELIGDRCTK